MAQPCRDGTVRDTFFVHKEAREALQTAEQVLKGGLSPSALALLAMTHKRLKEDKKAEACLARARKAAPAPLPDVELAPGLKLRAVLEEAERVVGGGNAAARPASR